MKLISIAIAAIMIVMGIPVVASAPSPERSQIIPVAELLIKAQKIYKMTQTQPRQFAQYTEQSQRFSSLIDQIPPNYVGVAWGIAHWEGLENVRSRSAKQKSRTLN
jgi:hypothetical protein